MNRRWPSRPAMVISSTRLYISTKAPATYQGYINKILVEKLNVFVIVYLDDIFIHTENEGEEHVQVVQWVLDQLRKYSLYINLKKCDFH